jgi:hypothetical protein
MNFFGCWRVSLLVGNGAAARTTLASGPTYSNPEVGPHGLAAGCFPFELVSRVAD